MRSAAFVFFISSVVAPFALAPRIGAADAPDSGFRCESGRLVRVGESSYEVHRKCGDPDAVIQRVEKRKVKLKVRRWVGDHEEEVSEERVVEVLVDEWTYDLGPRRFIRYALFEDGRLAAVRTGGYGTKKE